MAVFVFFSLKDYLVIAKKAYEKPVKVYVYRTDTVYRKIIEKDTLIIGIKFTPNLAEIHTISPSGTPLINQYPLNDFREININHKGYLQIDCKKLKRKKALKIVGKVAIFVGRVLVGSQI